MIFETTGGVNSEGLEMLRQLFRFAAKHQNLQFLAVYNFLFLNVFLIAQERIEKDVDFFA